MTPDGSSSGSGSSQSEDDSEDDNEVVREVDERGGQYFSSMGVDFVINPAPEGIYIHTLIHSHSHL